LFTWVICVHAFGPALRQEYIKATLRRVSAYNFERLRDRQLAMARLAEATAEIDAAQLLFAPTSMQWKAVPNHGTLLARTGSALWRASGAHMLFEGSSIQRNFRDLHAMSQHGGADIDNALSDYGKFLLDPEGFLAASSGRQRK
jgi:3-hydroxy-9,10-secoandrosta-1,3,5(10)-triene-9,17-dione monooxygenase